MYTILPFLSVLADQTHVNEVQLGSLAFGMAAAGVYHLLLARFARRAVRGRG